MSHAPDPPPWRASHEADDDAMLTHWQGEPVRIWARVWGVPHLEIHSTVGSTNDRARELFREGAPPLTTVLAEEQTQGRGRSGRSWQAPPGRGLLLSTVLDPPAPGLLVTPLVVGLAAARAMEEVASVGVAVKWPNDLLIRGRKVCGVLCEAVRGDDFSGVVAGVGVNVGQRKEDFPPAIRDGATSLELESGEHVSRSELAGATVRFLKESFSRGPESLEGELGEELVRRDALRDRLVVLEDGTRAQARRIAADGALVVQGEEGERRVVGGSVRLLGDSRDS